MSGFLSFLLVMLVAGVFGVIAMMHKLKEPGPLSQDKIVYMPPGSETSEMVTQLQREGVRLLQYQPDCTKCDLAQSGHPKYFSGRRQREEGDDRPLETGMAFACIR